MVNETRKTKPCCCYGSNQNCMHCYGSGIIEIKYIEGTDSNLLSNNKNIIESPNKTNKNTVTTHISNIKEIRNAINNLTECVKCKVKLAKNNITYVNDKEVYCNHCIKGEIKDLRKCLFCNKFVSKHYLDKHFEEIHSNRKYYNSFVTNSDKHLLEKYSSTKHNKNTKVQTSNLDKNTSKNTNVSFETPRTFNPKNTKVQNKLVDCEYCKCKVRETRLDKHKRKVHKNNLFDKSSNENVELKTKSKTDVSNKVSNNAKNKYPENDNFYDQRNNNLQKTDYYHEKQIEKKLDYTSNYYNFYREEGRFGSHPSHDDYGEESDY